jgi:3-methyl-2-oxobutanoate hydroxymethyltransferase
MGHLGLTPQSVLEFGGYRVQGRGENEAAHLLEEARAIQEAGCFSLVLEGVPSPVAEHITGELDIPTVGIGAGPECDGQILVITDLLGMSVENPKFVRKYADLRATILDAVRRYADDVQEGRFPDSEETYTE